MGFGMAISNHGQEVFGKRGLAAGSRSLLSSDGDLLLGADPQRLIGIGRHCKLNGPKNKIWD
jgi:hypothetical protein